MIFCKDRMESGDVTANSLEFMFDTEEEFDRCKTAFDGSMILNRHRGNASADLAFVGNDKGNAIRLLTQTCKYRPERYDCLWRRK